MENPIKNKTISNERESKEKIPDFKQIFEDKLQKIEPAVGQDAKDWATWYDDSEIAEIAKEVPAVFFDPNNLVNLAPPTDIWIEDPESLEKTSYYIHDQVGGKLGEFMGKS